MNRLEAEVVDVCKQGFAELQQVETLSIKSIESWATPKSFSHFVENCLFTSVFLLFTLLVIMIPIS